MLFKVAADNEDRLAHWTVPALQLRPISVNIFWDFQRQSWFRQSGFGLSISLQRQPGERWRRGETGKDISTLGFKGRQHSSNIRYPRLYAFKEITTLTRSPERFAKGTDRPSAFWNNTDSWAGADRSDLIFWWRADWITTRLGGFVAQAFKIMGRMNLKVNRHRFK